MHRPSHRPARRRFGVILAGSFLVAAAAAGGVVWRLSWMDPTWWVPPAPQDAQAAALADRVEFRLTEEAHKIREDPDFRLRITQEQINAWLATRLPAWVAHTSGEPWPEWLGLPQVRFTEGAVSVGIDVLSESGRRVVVAEVRPRVTGGRLELPVESVGVGRVRIPGASVAALVDRLRGPLAGELADDEALGALAELLRGERPLDPVLRLADGRTVELLEVSCTGGAMVLRCRTK